MLFMTFIFVFCLALIFLVLFVLLSFKHPFYQTQKMTAFECGFEPLSVMRSPYSARFFIIVVLFLVFDVEAALLLPIISSFMSGDSLSMCWALIFVLTILVGGLFHEWREGVLDWMSSFLSKLT
uniref:NADH-ubiquinone oxidoreductase chain 3 n=1 Tax=Pedipes pedipes TaxID=999235 RepID=G8HPB8_9EUPU|nr:NADH dehydrogenase subunit 3 [Pedipes pedipes]AEQ93862.1 NADH dehydrogenase subunit 3 [Pedipes pedipes]